MKHPLGPPPKHLKFVFAGDAPRAACNQPLHTDFMLQGAGNRADQGCSRSACTRVAGADSGSHKYDKPQCQATQASCAMWSHHPTATTPPPRQRTVVPGASFVSCAVRLLVGKASGLQAGHARLLA